MDTFENREFDQTPEESWAAPEQTIPQQPYTNPYHGAGTGRKESPYANSPYEMHHAPGRSIIISPRPSLP